jgi:DNA modification methylase
MKPYYDDGAGIVIYHGDCREVLPALGRFDLLLTDPPYGIGEHGGKCRTRGAPRYAKHASGEWDNATPSQDVFNAMLSAADHAVIWGGNYFTDKLPVSRGWLYWQKLMGGDFSDGELAWTSRDMALREYTKCGKYERSHPAEKPIGLFLWCLSFFPESKSVLDPFMGSGTALRAAKDKGLRATGVEREKRYCEIAARRLQQGVLFPAQ